MQMPSPALSLPGQPSFTLIFCPATDVHPDLNTQHSGAVPRGAHVLAIIDGASEEIC
jgi:hypothetical protein